MMDLFQKSTTQSAKKLHIGAALWDGIIYPLRSKEIIRVYIFWFIYSLLLGVLLGVVLVVILIVASSNDAVYEFLKISTNPEEMKKYTNLKEIPILYLLLFYCSSIIIAAPLNGYFITIIQNSLKDNDKPPRFKFKNLRRLFTLGIKAGVISLLTAIIMLPLPYGESENPALAILNNMVPYLYFITSIATTISKNNQQYSLIISYFLVSLYLFFVPSILVTFSRRGCLSDLLPLSQYSRYLTDKNYFQISIIYFLIVTVPSIYMYLQKVVQIYSYLYIILSVYLTMALYRIIGKQWKTIKKRPGHRKVLCDTTIQTKLDNY